MATRTAKTIRSGAIGFVAGVATLGVVAGAQPLHSAVSGVVAGEPPEATRQAWTPPAQPDDGWLIPQDQAQQQPYVQPAPQQAPQSQAS